jgi:hypothetical protein
MQLEFNQGAIVYVIYTSGLIVLESTFKYDNPVFAAIWEEIEELIRQESFKIIDFVEEEINSYEGKQDFLKKVGTEMEKTLCGFNRRSKHKRCYSNN